MMQRLSFIWIFGDAIRILENLLETIYDYIEQYIRPLGKIEDIWGDIKSTIIHKGNSHLIAPLLHCAQLDKSSHIWRRICMMKMKYKRNEAERDKSRSKSEK